MTGWWQGWWRGWAVYRDRRMALILALGFASGLPQPMVYANLSVWLKDSGLTLGSIALFGSLSTPYALNFLWAPLVDRLSLPGLGRRRGWLLLCQGGIALSLLALSLARPEAAVWPIIAAGLCLAIFSATQDVVIDALRIELLTPETYGAGSAVAVFGWHLGATVGGAGGLFLAAELGWPLTYRLALIALAVGVAAALLAPEPAAPARPAAAAPGAPRPKRLLGWLKETVVAPLADFARRPGWLWVLAFIVVFKMGDALLGRMSNLFYRELGFSYEEIAEVAKIAGLAGLTLGAFAGGVAVKRLGTLKALFLAGLLMAATNLLYAWLATRGADQGALALAVVSDQFTSGLGLTTFVAYLSGLCSLAFTATQYALLASLANFARIQVASASGWMVEGLAAMEGWIGAHAWSVFFILTALLALPGLALLAVLMRRLGDGEVPARTRPD
ncbi:AmpG family muropeptide MFS transporter [Roseospirillum parvum]|uniref:MFS transporter, PAT family, beta-lactamase induction signal transducer AmpG n=1 Tax=Roseospirillum parvum TaxID=83401 RepID=A0A1G8FWS4_9PROT|nr:MFS transporter [Roseospirillum parvum]SDH86426.1 MFS transporter, PAT family, beta-lactamase induction signal transducer AmpG [Roseospirillum parvum]